MERVLTAVARLVLNRPWTVILLYTALAVAGALAAAAWLGLQTAENALVSNELEYNRRYHRFLEAFGDQEYMYVVVEVDDLPTAMRVADAVAAEIEPLRESGVVRECVSRLETSRLRRVGLLFVPMPDLERLVRFVEEHAEEISTLLSLDSLAGLCRFALERFDPESARLRPELARFALEVLADGLALLERTVAGQPPTAEQLSLGSYVSTLERRASAGELKAVLGHRLLRQALARGYLVSGDLLFVLVMPRKDRETLETIREPLAKVREALSRVRERFPGVRLGLTGRPVLQADQMQTTSDDMTRAVILAIAAILYLFMVFFRGIRRPLLTGLTLAYAIGITFGIVTITVGYLNLLSIVFAIMMISLGTEFGIHVIARYHQESSRRHDLEDALRRSIVTTGKGNVTGAVTTAAAFYSTLFVDFKGLAELGFIAGTGVLVCMLAMNSLLPALLLVTDRWKPPRHRAEPLRMSVFGVFARLPRTTLATAILLLVISVPFFADRRFDSNLLELQAEGLSSVEFEKTVIENQGMKTWYAAFLTDRPGVSGLVERLSGERYEGVVGGVESVLDYVPEDQDEKSGRIRRMAARLRAGSTVAAERAWPPVAAAPDIGDLRDALEGLLDRLDTALSAVARRDGQSSELLARLTDSLDRLVEKLGEESGGLASRLGTLQVGAFAELRSWLGTFLDLLDPQPLSLEDLDPTIVKRVHSRRTGDYLVYAYPAKDIWQPANLAEFVRVTHEVSPEVTGLPEQIYQSTEIMKRGFFLAAIYSLVAVFILIWLDFRSLLYSTLAVLPVVLGIVWTIAVLPLFGMTLNLANFFSVPILIGAGINGGVHMIHRHREDPRAQVVTGSTGTAVVLSALTNMTGFGMLLFSHHRGIVSLGGVMVLGAAVCLLASMAVLPAVLRLLPGTPPPHS